MLEVLLFSKNRSDGTINTNTLWSNNILIYRSNAGNIANNLFGYCIKTSNQARVIVAGAPGNNGSNGFVEVWRKAGPYDEGWQFGESISFVTAGKNFGTSVDISDDGNIIAASSPFGGSGFVSVFRFNGSSWVRDDINITGSNSSTSTYGTSISLSGNGTTLAVGGNTDNSNIGAVWIHIYNGTTWVEQAKLLPFNFTGTPFAGRDVALSSDGNVISFSSSGSFDSNRGNVWVYTRSVTTWTPRDKFVGGTSSFIGRCCISGNGNVVIPLPDTSNINSIIPYYRNELTNVWSPGLKFHL